MLTEWTSFFATTASCAATLTGLLFVGLSISLKLVLRHPQLPARARESVLLLLHCLLLSGLVLLPAQAPVALGWKVLVLGLLTWGNSSWQSWQGWRLVPPERRDSYVFNLLLTQLILSASMGAGICLLCLPNYEGLHLAAAAVGLTFIKVLLDAWLLLIEINR